MTPHKINHRGSYVLDRQFPGIGRVRRASRTQDIGMFRRLDHMLTELYERGRADLLRGIKDGLLTPMQVYERYRQEDLNRLPSAETMTPFKAAYDAWVKAHECSEGHRTALTHSGTALLKHAKAGITVEEAPSLLRKYRVACKAAGTPRMFNRTRSAVQAFLRATLGKSHRLYLDVGDIKVMRLELRDGSALRPDQLRDYIKALPAKHQHQAWAMALTGMGPREYWESQWSQGQDRITILGTKRKGRRRVVPLIAPIAAPRTNYQAFRVALAKASKKAVTPYDLRRSFAYWMEEAGITETRRSLYMGHGPKSMTELYSRHEVDSHLIEDGAKLRKHLGLEEGVGLALVR